MKNFTQVLILILAVSFGACSYEYVPSAKGELDEVLVLIDTAKAGEQVVEALLETFAKPIETLPGFETMFRIRFQGFSTEKELDAFRRHPNIVVAAPLDEPSGPGALVRALLNEKVEDRVRSGDVFAFPVRDLWARHQWTLILTSMDGATLASNLADFGEPLVNQLIEAELERRPNEIYRKGEQVHLSDSLMQTYGWSVRMQHDYVWLASHENFVRFRRYLPDNDRWMWAWWQDGFDDPGRITPEFIQQKRDSLLQVHMRGERENSYMETEYRRAVITRFIEHPDYLAFETLGTWNMVGDFMGGPFVNFVYHDPNASRLYIIEYGQFAPNIGKRRFVRQFRAMGRTFTTASKETSPE